MKRSLLPFVRLLWLIGFLPVGFGGYALICTWWVIAILPAWVLFDRAGEDYVVQVCKNIEQLMFVYFYGHRC